MKLSFHVQEIPCAEEYYMGASVTHEAYWIDIPDEYFPKPLLEVVKHRGEKDYRKSIVNIAVHAKED